MDGHSSHYNPDSPDTIHMAAENRFQFSELFRRAWVKGMTMTNVIQGFKVTEIYPFNLHALIPKPILSPVSRFHNIGADSGLKFIPLFSPAPDRCKKPSTIANYHSTDLSLIEEDSDTEFTPEEINLFTRRFDEGYDVYDERYEQLKQKEESCAVQLQSAAFENTLSKKTQHLFRRLIQEPPLVSQDVAKPTMKTGSARVLNSIENMHKSCRRKTKEKS